MWSVVYVAFNKETADKVKDRLTKEGFLVRLHPLSKNKGLYEIQVPEAEAEDAHNILITYNIV